VSCARLPPCGVHDRVDATELRQPDLDHPLDLLPVSGVRADRHRRAARGDDVVGERLHPLLGDVGEHQPVARRGEQPGGRTPEAAARFGHQHDSGHASLL